MMDNKFLLNNLTKGKVLALIEEYKSIRRFHSDLKLSFKELQNVKSSLAEDLNEYRVKMNRVLREERLFSNFEIVKAFISVIDNLELGVSTITDKKNSEGFNLVLHQFYTILKSFDVVLIDPLNGSFDPNLHEVITSVKDITLTDNSIFKVIRKGFSLNKKLIRPASVIIIKNS